MWLQGKIPIRHVFKRDWTDCSKVLQSFCKNRRNVCRGVNHLGYVCTNIIVKKITCNTWTKNTSFRSLLLSWTTKKSDLKNLCHWCHCVFQNIHFTGSICDQVKMKPKKGCAEIYFVLPHPCETLKKSTILETTTFLVYVTPLKLSRM